MRPAYFGDVKYFKIGADINRNGFPIFFANGIDRDFWTRLGIWVNEE
jgi:hypothetical protein